MALNVAYPAGAPALIVLLVANEQENRNTQVIDLPRVPIDLEWLWRV
jgi:hypothetical protein